MYSLIAADARRIHPFSVLPAGAALKPGAEPLVLQLASPASDVELVFERPSSGTVQLILNVSGAAVSFSVGAADENNATVYFPAGFSAEGSANLTSE